MKNLRNIFALLILTVAFYSCDSTVSIDDPDTETTVQVTTKTGEEGNDGDIRDD
jgi:predicted component of type VI protein secretion system